MQREECNETISNQDTRAQGGLQDSVEAEIISLVSCDRDIKTPTELKCNLVISLVR